MAPRTNDSDHDRRLVRFLHGELAPVDARQLEAELGRDPALAARLAELERLWRGLEPPAAEPEPMSEGARLARATLERERRRRERPLGWLLGEGLAAAPAWGRPLAAGALAAGLALGLWLGQPRQVESAAESTGEETSASRRERSATATIPAAEEKLAAAAPEPPAIRLPAVPLATPAARSELEDDALASAEPALAGEGTLAEAYLQAMEAGDAYDWEGSGP